GVAAEDEADREREQVALAQRREEAEESRPKPGDMTVEELMDNGPEERRRTASALSALSSSGSMGRPKANSNVSDVMDLVPEAFVRQRSEARGSSMLDLSQFRFDMGAEE
ncbi:unnamed protein product, partial [Prorocentrum cordatum]